MLEVARIDRGVGLHAMTPAVFDSYTLKWSTTNAKGVEKKLPEQCSFWNSDILVEVAAEIDLTYHAMFLENPDMGSLPPLDYRAPGFDDAGIIVLFGGDHGAGACPCSLKLNFSSPQVRKERGELNYRCPTIQIASIDCTKDSYELLSRTVMSLIKSQMIRLRNSADFVIYSVKHPKIYRKAFLFPKFLNTASFVLQGKVMSYREGMHHKVIDLGVYFDSVTTGADFAFGDLRTSKVVGNFHDLYVGDLAFLAMAIGMNNSSGAHCIQCTKKAREFNCDQINDVRTKASLTECVNEFNRQRLTNKSIRNHKGVNTLGFLDIDPQRIIVPILHSPMGLVDKVLETFKAWAIWEVELLPGPSNEIREAYRNALEAYPLAVNFEDEARQMNEHHGNTQATVALHNNARQARVNATVEVRKAKLKYDEMTKRHNARLFSYSQSLDVAFCRNNIKKEHYHGGKYNGVNCIRIMEQSDVLFPKFASLLKQKKVATKTDVEIDSKCSQFQRLFVLLDVIWSNVRGIEAGLLPTDAQIEILRRALSEGKTMWNAMGIKTLQPKWHLTFDGHYLQQVIKYGGLADKADDTIELQHQILMKLRNRY